MIPKQGRFPLRSHQDVFRKSTRVSGVALDVFLSPAPENHSQASVVVGKNVSLKATVRNHVKRVLGEILRLDILPSSTRIIIVRAKQNSKNTSYAKLKEELTHLVTKN